MWYNPDALNAGIFRIGDLYDMNTSTFYTYHKCVEKYGVVMPMLAYNGLIASIPNRWKIILRDRIMVETEPVGIEKIPQGVKFTSYYYWFMIRKEYLNSFEPTKILWETDLNIRHDDKAWEQITLIPFTLVASTKL